MTGPGDSLDRILGAAGRGRLRRLPRAPETRLAAVAAVVRDTPDGPGLLLIRRADHPEDPWSGHMAFPGGRVEPGESPEQAVRRETLEEIGLDLDRDAVVHGSLSDVAAVARGRPLQMVILPFLFELVGDPELMPNHEVEEIVWVPLSFLLDRANRSTVPWSHGGATIHLPCYRWHGRVIWGLTFAMIDELLERIDAESG